VEYPENCIRGIPNKEFVVSERLVATHLFFFKREDLRNDGWVEQSINWQDDNGAIEFTLNQTKEDGQLQFNAGVAILPRAEIDRLRSLAACRDQIAYERQPITGNRYHGNFLLHGSMGQAVMKQVAAALALRAEYIPRSEPSQ
jgi:hypothetical protein